MSFEKAQDWLQSFKAQQIHAQNRNLFNQKKAQKFAIASGKGGVGKTTIALKLSLELAELGNKVLLIDFDYNLSNTAIKLGLPLNNNFYDLVNLSKTLDECLYRKDNFHLLPGCSGHLELNQDHERIESYLLDVISDMESKYDYIFIDCPAGLGKETLFVGSICDQRIIVVNPDRSSLTDSYSLIKLLNMAYGVEENFLVVNKVRSKEDFFKSVKTISGTAESFLQTKTHVLGAIKYFETEGLDFDDFILDRDNFAASKVFNKVASELVEKHKGSHELF